MTSGVPDALFRTYKANNVYILLHFIHLVCSLELWKVLLSYNVNLKVP